MTYKAFEYDENLLLSWKVADSFLRRHNITPDNGVNSKRFFIAAKQIIIGKRKRLRCSIVDKMRLDEVLKHIKKCDGDLRKTTDLEVKVDLSDFVIKEEYTETKYHEKEVQEEVEEVIIQQEEPMIELVEKTWQSKRTRNVGYSKAQASAHNAIVDRIPIYRRLSELERMPRTPETQKEIEELYLKDHKMYKGRNFQYEWLQDPQYEKKVEKGGTETYFEVRKEVTKKPPVPVETIRVRKKLITNIVREPYECQTVRYRKIEESKVWKTVGQKKQMEIIHGIFLFEGEPGFAPLRSYIRYKDYNRENMLAKQKNEETKNKYMKIKSWEAFNKRKVKGKRQKKKNYDKYMEFIKDKTPLLEEDYKSLMKELIVPILPAEEVPLEKRYERVEDAVESFLCLRDHRRGVGTQKPKTILPSRVVRCLSQIWTHFKHGIPMKEIKEGDRMYWTGFHKARRRLRFRKRSHDSLNEMTNSEYIELLAEGSTDYGWDDSDFFLY
jgi:hypothetical protein